MMHVLPAKTALLPSDQGVNHIIRKPYPPPGSRFGIKNPLPKDRIKKSQKLSTVGFKNNFFKVNFDLSGYYHRKTL
jgi:hypothetical protein